MPSLFTADELDVLRHTIEPKRNKMVVFSMLDERYEFPEWVHQAFEHGWEPPHQWHKEERDRIGRAIGRLMEQGILRPNINWKLAHTKKHTEMELLAQQASEPKKSVEHGP